ncbi:DUF6777 domain-containing protein [Streptomyces sp. NPDC127084]|uniref:DUF6777 domain-containing protein n=1 Tax=Streptomyces sp. NPDC127084 TaxID=3347133 RepID=UPI003652BB84
MYVCSSTHRRYARLAAQSAVLSAALLVTGCSKLTGSGQGGTEARQQVHLQPASDLGPDPFTPSTATLAGAAGPLSAPRARASAPPSTAPSQFGAVRTVLGSTPGLYGGTRSIASCDVEQQIRFLTVDANKGRAFASGAGVSQEDLPEFLRGLTPVVLRADVRVTGHSYRAGSAQRFQSVLQSGTAVLVDEHGSPRVRCASGSPLASPVIESGAVEEQGREWPGYEADRVVVVTRSAGAIKNLIIADVAGNSWLARTSGTDGEADRKPDVLPPYAPGLHVTDVPAIRPGGPADSSSPRPILPDASPSASPGTKAKDTADGSPRVNPPRPQPDVPQGVPLPDAPAVDGSGLTGQGVPMPDAGTDPGMGYGYTDGMAPDGMAYDDGAGTLQPPFDSDSGVLFGPAAGPGAAPSGPKDSKGSKGSPREPQGADGGGAVHGGATHGGAVPGGAAHGGAVPGTAPAGGAAQGGPHQDRTGHGSAPQGQTGQSAAPDSVPHGAAEALGARGGAMVPGGVRGPVPNAGAVPQG